jgi:GNAT superfamily N-acetyltransferase
MGAGSRSPTISSSIRTRSRINLRPFDEARDSDGELTQLLNAAYRRLADMGLNYVAATQDAEMTRRRIGLGDRCFVMCADDGKIAGTICYYSASRGEHGPAWYARSEVGHFGQFAVLPELQGSGIGSTLLEAVEELALAYGKAELACDTAEPARHLLEYYNKLGFRTVGRHRWPHARYESVILSKALKEVHP